MKPLAGIVAPIPTCFDEAQDLALDRLAENLARWNRTGLSGFAVLGSSGEFVYLSQDEKKSVLEKAREAIPASKLMLAGTGCESTRKTVALTRWAGGMGADYAMVVTPSYYKRSMTSQALSKHFLTVAEASTIPIVLYNVPVFTGLNMPLAVVSELATHPNIAGIKDSHGDIEQLQDIYLSTPDDFAVLTGAGHLLLAALFAGARGGILGVANVAFDLCLGVVAAFERGDHVAARRLQARLIPVSRAVTSGFGIAGMKALLDRIGFYGGPVRAPQTPVSDEARERLECIYAASCPEALPAR
jgi:4-hydroxy-2-oxoglutarate aldolase